MTAIMTLTITRVMTGGIFVFLLLMVGTNCLLCYQCGTTSQYGPTSDCFHDLHGLMNTSRGLDKKYFKNCTADRDFWDRCMIEVAEFNGKLSTYHRGCHDGVSFSQKFYSDRFHDLPPNNYTTCDSIGNRLVCYTFCDTDFCNGPQVPVREPTVCEMWADNPYDFELPPNVTCSAVGMHTNSGPIGLQLLVLVTVSVFFIAGLRSL